MQLAGNLFSGMSFLYQGFTFTEPSASWVQLRSYLIEK
jgi:hypothetical protein